MFIKSRQRICLNNHHHLYIMGDSNYIIFTQNVLFHRGQCLVKMVVIILTKDLSHHSMVGHISLYFFVGYVMCTI